MILYQSSVSAAEQMAQTTPEQAQAGMAEWMKWKENPGDAVVDFGMPLTAGKHVESGREAPSTSQIGGYSIIQAESLDAAVALVKDHPHFKARAVRQSRCWNSFRCQEWALLRWPTTARVGRLIG